MGKRVAEGIKRVKQSQRELESSILRRCASGRDRLDKRLATGVKIIKVAPGSTGSKDFPRLWKRDEGDRTKIRGSAEWYIPRRADLRRRMLFLHGGSYVVYAPCDSVYRSLASRLASQCGLCVLSIDYRLAPEHRFPAAFEDACAALKWLSVNGPPEVNGQGKVKGAPFSASPARDLFVCGDSAGGGLALAASMAQRAFVRERLRGVIGLSAWNDLTASTPSYDTRQWCPEQCWGDAVNAGVDRKSGREEAEAYLGRRGVQLHGRDWRASPFFAPAGRLRALPSVLLQVGDFELILDESVLLHKRLEKLGHPDARVDVYPRMWHCWHQYEEGSGALFGMKSEHFGFCALVLLQIMAGLGTLSQAKKALRDVKKWVEARIT
ncbi:unnamed protein product [Durusdinium trenchii]|uniref:Alpha/beta hydrolase fold-3 domain-containing protein n=1 Tax=Durusdinium trenchii TaxID=1381693 RepID=A0ABP0HHJ8_9DINO